MVSMQQTYLHTSSSTPGLIASPSCSQWIRYLVETSSRVTLVKPMEMHIETALLEMAVEKFNLKKAIILQKQKDKTKLKNFHGFS